MTNSEKDPYLIGYHKPEKENYYWVLYEPVPDYAPKEMISVFYGSNPSKPQGPCLEPERILKFVMGTSVWKNVDGKDKFLGWKEEPPGWFRRQCEAAGCLWFYRMVESMAAGEEVPIEEIKAAYRKHNGGKELPQIPIHDLR